MANSIFHKLKSKSGLTLMELMVSLVLVGILMIIFISGNIFVQKILTNWSSNTRLYEEREWILNRLQNLISDCDNLESDADNNRWRFYFLRDTIECHLEDGLLSVDGKLMHNKDFGIAQLSISKIAFTKTLGDTILAAESESVKSSLYSICLELEYKGQSDVFKTVVRNKKEYIFSQN